MILYSISSTAWSDTSSQVVAQKCHYDRASCQFESAGGSFNGLFAWAILRLASTSWARWDSSSADRASQLTAWLIALRNHLYPLILGRLVCLSALLKSKGGHVSFLVATNVSSVFAISWYAGALNQYRLIFSIFKFLWMNRHTPLSLISCRNYRGSFIEMIYAPLVGALPVNSTHDHLMDMVH